MKYFRYIIIFWFLVGFLSGCRASKELKARYERTCTEVIGVELRRVDSLWSSIAEKLSCKIEFYPIEYDAGRPAADSTCPADPCSTMPAASSRTSIPSGNVGSSGIGSVKSIEFTIEHNAQTTSTNQVDSTYNSNTASAETLQEEKASEARQDTCTVFIVSVAAAVLLLLIIIIKKLFHK